MSQRLTEDEKEMQAWVQHITSAESGNTYDSFRRFNRVEDAIDRKYGETPLYKQKMDALMDALKSYERKAEEPQPKPVSPPLYIHPSLCP